jgi:hypothetical protein
MSLTIEQILEAKEDKVAEVPVPEWGGTVFVRQLSGLESVNLAGSLRNIEGDETAIARERLVGALAAYLCDANGASLATMDQARVIAGKSALAVNRIVMAGHKLNALDEQAIDTSAKNSEPSRADISPTV